MSSPELDVVELLLTTRAYNQHRERDA